MIPQWFTEFREVATGITLAGAGGLANYLHKWLLKDEPGTFHFGRFVATGAIGCVCGYGAGYLAVLAGKPEAREFALLLGGVLSVQLLPLALRIVTHCVDKIAPPK